jgi:hypothetical protein
MVRLRPDLCDVGLVQICCRDVEHRWASALQGDLGYPAATRAAVKTSSGMGCSSCQVMAIGRSPVWLT